MSEKFSSGKKTPDRQTNKQTQGCLVPSYVEISLEILEKKLFESLHFCYFIICFIAPSKWVCLNVNKLYMRIPALGLVEIVRLVLKEEIFKMLPMYLHYIAIISPWKRAWRFVIPFTWMICAKFSWNWPVDSGEEDKIVKSVQTGRNWLAFQVENQVPVIWLMHFSTWHQ